MKRNQPKTCLASARISSAKQISGESLSDQVKVIKAFTKTKGWEILPDGEVAREIHGASVRRPVYEKHIQYIKNNPNTVGYYIIRYIDRLTRGGVGDYNAMKKELRDLGVELIDTNGIIQPKKNSQEMDNLGFEYEWSSQSSSEITEEIIAMEGARERKRILNRTIPKQIDYTQQGFHIGKPDDGYKSVREQFGGQLRCVLVPNGERAMFIQKMFELRAENKLTDHQIVDVLNDKYGYRSQSFSRWSKDKTTIIGKGGGKKLTTKQLQRNIQRTAYAGILCEKWTHNKPVKAKWDGLVSIEMFNLANRDKVYIEKNGEEFEILYDKKLEKRELKRLRYNPEYPFKCIQCPVCGSQLKGSASTGKSGKKFPSYHCSRGHKRFSVARKVMNNTIEDYLSKLKYSDGYLEVLEEGVKKIFKQKQQSLKDDSTNSSSRIRLMESEKDELLNSYISVKSETIKSMLEDKLTKIEERLEVLEKQSNKILLQNEDITDLIKYMRKIVEHPQKTLIDKDNPLRQEALLELTFDSMPTYEELDSGTPKLSFIFNGYIGKKH